MLPFELVWRYPKLAWTLAVLLVGLVAVGGLFGGGPLPLVAGAFVVVLTTVGYGAARALFRTRVVRCSLRPRGQERNSRVRYRPV